MAPFYIYDAAGKKHMNGKAGQSLVYTDPDRAWEIAADMSEGNPHLSLIATTAAPGTPATEVEPYYD